MFLRSTILKTNPDAPEHVMSLEEEEVEGAYKTLHLPFRDSFLKSLENQTKEFELLINGKKYMKVKEKVVTETAEIKIQWMEILF